LPHLIRGLRHFHMIGARGEIHRADAERRGVRASVHFCVERDALGDRMVHPFLHEAAMVLVFHVHWRFGGFLLCPDRGG